MTANLYIFEEMKTYKFMDFSTSKKRILADYLKALELGLIDEEMISINKSINSIPFFVTTSTCAGRLILISKSKLRSKYETTFHFKTHKPSEILEINFSDINFEEGLWMLVEAPNLHIRCRNPRNAKELHQIALKSKLSKSKFQSIEPALVVEILGTGSLQIPLGHDGEILVNSEYTEFVLNQARDLLFVEQKRLGVFHKFFIDFYIKDK